MQQKLTIHNRKPLCTLYLIVYFLLLLLVIGLGRAIIINLDNSEYTIVHLVLQTIGFLLSAYIAIDGIRWHLLWLLSNQPRVILSDKGITLYTLSFLSIQSQFYRWDQLSHFRHHRIRFSNYLELLDRTDQKAGRIHLNYIKYDEDQFKETLKEYIPFKN